MKEIIKEVIKIKNIKYLIIFVLILVLLAGAYAQLFPWNILGLATGSACRDDPNLLTKGECRDEEVQQHR